MHSRRRTSANGLGIAVICLCLFILPAVCESAKYEVGTIVAVNARQSANSDPFAAGNYEISVKVAETIYTVLYVDTLGTGAVKHAAGRELLVCVGKNTITYNDILGRSQEVPIIGRKSATSGKQSN